ncbi:Tetraspanin family-domain-containing protein [Zopfochytrium polystomum]|nr:Tetraspanin family-domain-containing protein [Zopfochytrium polystomum]
MPDVVVVDSGGGQRPKRNPFRLVCVRILLVLISLGMLSGGILTMVVGIAMKKLVDTEMNSGKDYAPSFDMGVRGISVSMIIYGSIMTFTGFFGFLGACTRVRGFISLFFFGLTLSLISVIGSGVFGIKRAQIMSQKWTALTPAAWKRVSNTDKAMFQYTYTCCGYDQGDSLAYTGPALFVASGGVNACSPSAQATTGVDPKDLPGCYEAGKSFWSDQESTAIGTMVGSLVGILVAALIAGCTQRYLREADDYPRGGTSVFFFGGGGGSGGSGGTSGGKYSRLEEQRDDRTYGGK